MTSVRLAGQSEGRGLAEYGRVSRDEMIEALKKKARRDLADAQAVLDADDRLFIVETYVGVIVQRKRELVL